MNIKNESILVMDFGGQYTQLIARRVREQNVYCEIKPYKISAEEILKNGYKGIIFSGGSNSVYGENSPKCDKKIFNLGIPVLGICYGAQIMAYLCDGDVSASEIREYGNTEVNFNNESLLFEDVSEQSIVWMSHTDYISKAPNGFKVTAYTSDCPVAAMEDREKKLYAVQFHPEVQHTVEGNKMLKNFLFNVCQCSGDWQMASFVSETVKALKEKIGDKKVLCGLSGGVDSSVAAVLVNKAVGKQLTCIFVDHGMLRKNEGDEVEKVFKEQFDINLIRVFEEEARKIGKVDFLCQGTIYPDVVESGTGEASVIKSHHNVGGLPENVDFEDIVEPLRDLFKDEVRKAGLELGIPEFLVWRQPFPGPGLAIRVMGDITEFKLNILKEADAIFREEVAKAGLDRKINQYFAVFTGVRSVGVMGDGRTYDYTIALRGVTTNDFMTADWARIPYDVLAKVSGRIINEVDHVNRVVYDITSKPPGTVEFE